MRDAILGMIAGIVLMLVIAMIPKVEVSKADLQQLGQGVQQAINQLHERVSKLEEPNKSK